MATSQLRSIDTLEQTHPSIYRECATIVRHIANTTASSSSNTRFKHTGIDLYDVVFFFPKEDDQVGWFERRMRTRFENRGRKREPEAKNHAGVNNTIASATGETHRATNL